MVDLPPYCMITSYLFSMIPEDHPDPTTRYTWALSVDYRGDDRWAVTKGGGNWSPMSSLGLDEEWSYDDIDNEEWMRAHRFDLETAMLLAANHLPKFMINGMTSVEVLARYAEQENSGD